MKIGAMNKPTNSISHEIDWIVKNNFEFIDLTFEPPVSKEMNIEYMKKLLEPTDLLVVGHTNPTLPIIYPLEGIKELCIKKLKESADFFKALGAKKMNIHPFYNAPHFTDEQLIEENIAVLKEIFPYCKNICLDLMLENYIAPFDNAKIFKEIIDQIPELKIHLDIGHCNLEGDAFMTVKEFFDTFGDRIIHLHVHDNDGEADEHLPIGCGCGDIYWKKIISYIKHSGFNETITLEVFCEDLDYLFMSKDKLRKLWEEA